MSSSLDSRDLRDLANELDDLREQRENDGSDDEHDAERLAALEGLERDLGDLHIAANHGVYLIHEDDFADHARDQAEELIGQDMRQWPFTCIDWDQAADDLKHDYTVIEFDGNTFYTRDV